MLTVHHVLDWNAGAPGSTLQLKRAYEQEGHEVDIYSFDDLRVATDNIGAQIAFPSLVAVRLFRRARLFDVIDATTGDAWLWATIAKRTKMRRPLLVTRSTGLEHVVHDALMSGVAAGHQRVSWRYPIYHGGFRLWEVQRSLKMADAKIFLTQADKDYAIHRLGIGPERCWVAPNGVADTLIGLPTQWASHPLRIAHMGTFIERKGVAYLMPAIQRLMRHIPTLQVSFLGTGCDDDVILAQLPKDLWSRVKIVRRYEQLEVPRLLAGHQITILASVSEGFGKTLVEAMACGVAVVSSRASGPAELIQDGHNGLLVPVRDSSAIEKAVQNLVDSPALLERVRRNGYATAQAYAWRSVARRRLEIYANELRRGGTLN